MGWVIKRSDGSYRCWNNNTQDDALLAGESWVQLVSMPAITPGPGAPVDPKVPLKAAVAADATVQASLKALVAVL